MSRNAISAKPEHYLFKIFRGSMPPDLPRGPKNIFSRRYVARKFFLGSTSPQAKNPRQIPVYVLFHRPIHFFHRELSELTVSI